METEKTQESAAIVEGLYHTLKGGTVIHGAELVNDKVCAIISEILDMEETGLISLTFRNDGYPDDVMGMAYPDTMSVAINMQRIFNISVELAKEEKHLSLRGILWSNLLTTILHDLHHIQAAYIDREALEESRKKHGADVLDESADEFAKEMLVKLARKVDIEPPMMAEMGVLSTMFMELMTTKAVEEEWLGKHLAMMEAGMLYVDEKESIEITTYREYLRQTLDSKNEKDPEWDEAVSAIDMVCRLENGSIDVSSSVPVVLPEIQVEPSVVDVPEGADNSIATDEAEEAIVEEQMAQAAANTAIPEAEVAVVAAAGAVVGQEGTEIVVPPQPVVAEVEAEVPAENTVVGQVDTKAKQMGLFATDVPAGDDNVVHENREAMMKDTLANTGAPVELNTAMQDEVPLPENVAAQQAAIANAANVTIPGPTTPKTYPDNGLKAEVIVPALQTIYQRCYHHIFTKCDRQLNSDIGFASPHGVLTPIQIGDIITRFGATNLVMEYDTLNATGQYASEKFTGQLRGTIMRKTQLPAFDLFLNIGGRCMKRRLVPQNPAKMKNNAYTPSAQEARDGNAVMWIIDRDAPQGGKAFIAKIKNNVYEAL